MGDLFNTFLSSIKYQFSRFLNRFRTITSRTYLKNKVWGKIKLFFSNLFNVKPKDKNDYYRIFNWLVSKRLAYLIVIVVGIVSVSFLYNNKTNFFGNDDDSIKSYKYSSVLLRFAKGDVRIKGKGGYLAYEGNVAKGKVTGKGKLYNHDENLLYEGEFDYNEYNGNGILYYPTGIVNYTGEFVDNEFEGTGTLYRDSGNIWYSGDFKKGMMDGEGVLYNVSGSQIFTGSFAADNIVYATLIGKTTEEVAMSYTGTRTLFEGEDFFNLHMEEIDAIYQGVTNEDALDDAVKVKAVYVLQDTFKTGRTELKTVDDLRSFFGVPLYAGESNMTQSEALAISEIRKTTGDTYFDDPGLVTTRVYDDDYSVDSFDGYKEVYIESYLYGGVEYTFVFKGRSDDNFGFYYITSK